MYFLSKSDAEVLLPTQPPFSWLILDFLHQTRGNTGSGNPIERQQSGGVVRYLLGRSGLVVMMLRPWNHAWTQSHHLMKALLEVMLLYKHQLLYDTYRIYICIYMYIHHTYLAFWLGRLAFVSDRVSKPMADSRPKGPQLRLGHPWVGELHPLSPMYGTRPCCLV